ncbi:unnamed protein product [Callosobruchus maculatus]|uniref:Mos1 transposase HTH domain-containing protein n=1 Tax=Callosobruchus maculatus TaxID=64391 RepID=A0A653CM26_CALMS|nr:unnamed protein product [Callosobruchus maculatus]
MFILFISLFYCRVGPTTIREISAVFTGFPKIRHLQKYCYLTYPIFSGSEARGCDCYFCEAEKTNWPELNGAKHLHRYLETQAYPL